MKKRWETFAYSRMDSARGLNALEDLGWHIFSVIPGNANTDTILVIAWREYT